MRLKKTTLLIFVLLSCGLASYASEFVNKNSSLTRTNIANIDMTQLENKLVVLKRHPLRYGHSGNSFVYQLHVLTTEEFQIQKPSGAFPFDAGFLGQNGDIFISEPVTSEQLSVFRDINQVALFYLCQAYITYYFDYSPVPDFLLYGFAAYEAHLEISDDAVKTALNSYGGSISTLEVLADRNNFISKNGFAVSYMFGEFMSAYHCWQYYNILKTTATTIETAPWWWETETLEKLIGKWNRYLYARILEPDENLRIKKNKETEHFIYYFRDAEAFNYPVFSDTLENAYREYSERLGVQALDKVTFFSIPECEAAKINGVACGNRLTSGTGWESGLNTTCAYESSQVPLFARQNRHELAHTFQQFIIPITKITQWMIEGFACFYESKGPFTTEVIGRDRQQLLTSMSNAEKYFGHRPTYDETRIYPSPDYGYYGLGTYFVDFMYRRGFGDQTIRDIYTNDVNGYKNLNFNTPDDFLNAFYYDFDVRIGQKGMVTLLSPSLTDRIYDKNVQIRWTPLDPALKLNVSVSLNDTSSWTPLATATTLTELSWEVPDGFLGKFYIRFRHPDYKLETIFGPFTKGDKNILSLIYPAGGENLFAGDSVSLSWAITNIPAIRIEYSNDNGNTWNMEANNVAATKGFYRWLVPYDLSDKCKIRITDISNNSIKSENPDVFRIIEANAIGGPYKTDGNTIVLMHFDNDLDNQSELTADGSCSEGNYYFSPGRNDIMRQCLKASLPVTIAHCDNLNLTGDWTIEAWVKVVDFPTNGNQNIVTKPGDSDSYKSNYSLQVSPYFDNSFFFFYFSKAEERIAISAPKPVLNEWYHVMFIRDTKNSEIKVIVRDKNLNIISSKSAAINVNETLINLKDLLICDNFMGYIDELRISNIIRKFEKPASASVPTPQNNSTGISSLESINLKWTNGTGTGKVDLLIDKSNPPLTKILDNVNAVNTYTLSSLEPATKYYWKVICRNQYGETDGPVWNFTTSPLTAIESNFEDSKALAIYPSPAIDKIYLKPGREIKGNAELFIFDCTGKIVYKEKILSEDEIKIETGNFASGVYYVQIKDADSVYNGRFVRK